MKNLMYKIIVFIPETHLEIVKHAMFNQGAGKYQHYSHCAWQVLGEGQFMPLSSSHAFIGEKNQLTKIPEYYVEMICIPDVIQPVIAALKEAHPYEEPAYQVIKLESF